MEPPVSGRGDGASPAAAIARVTQRPLTRAARTPFDASARRVEINRGGEAAPYLAERDSQMAAVDCAAGPRQNKNTNRSARRA